MADPALLDRVKKLLALAGSPNPHEAALAAARAQALVAKHRLEAWLAAEEVVERDPDPITDGRDVPLETARRLRKYKVVLASALADANGCVAWTWDAADGERLCLVGRTRDREAARMLWDPLSKAIEWLSATAGPGKDRAWHDAFRIGAVDAIAARLRDGEAEVRETLGAALVHVDPRLAAHDAALDRFVADHFGTAKGRALRVDAAGLRAGQRAGAALPIPPRRDR